ncbi:phosphatase PAP2 family protein [Mariniphaga sp.]|uniref:phosphatase PAP2 family protein n=1 Tax=Mariniphaga sp. TaxID=1954475 RepID=UPI00356A787B
MPLLKISIVLQFLIFGISNPLFSKPPVSEKVPEKNLFLNNPLFFSNSNYYRFHEDSIHRLNFRYPDKKRGLKPWIAPILLMSTGTALHFSSETKSNVRNFVEENLSYHGKVDDYLQYAPGAAVYAFNAAGIKGINNFGNSTAIMVKSFLLNGLITDRLKYWINEPRPNGGVRSFPSGHTSKAFMFAHFMHKEFGELSPWYSVGAYSAAATVGYMRVAKSAHWISDVLMGAGIGILSTELVYLTHQYKWDNEHLKRFDIFPFQFQNQKGVTLVYNF